MGKQLVILAGPSCVGKGPARAALARTFPELCARLGRVVLYTSRSARPGEKDGVHYHFRDRNGIENLDRSRFVIAKVRKDIQAMDMDEVAKTFQTHDTVFAECYPTLATALGTWALEHLPSDLSIVRVAMVPLSDTELNQKSKIEMRPVRPVLNEIMRAKLVGRKQALKNNDTAEEIDSRSGMAFDECQMMIGYEHHIVNHVGEDQVNSWGANLAAEPQRTMEELAAVLDPRLKWYHVGYGKIFYGPGPGDGSDGEIGSDVFFGTQENSEMLAKHQCNNLSDDYRDVGFWIKEVEELHLRPWQGYTES